MAGLAGFLVGGIWNQQSLRGAASTALPTPGARAGTPS
jgi:hypothetical protein